MSRTLSPSSNRSYGVARVIAVWQLARSSYYAARQRQQHPRPSAKRGPKRLSDEELAREIRQVLDQSIFHGEGYRKVWARLRHKGIRAWKDRVLRVMREHQLLSPSRRPDARPTNPHEGSIVAQTPNQLWGTDATATFTEEDGQVTVFAAIDHCSADCIGIHAIKRAHRFRGARPDPASGPGAVWFFLRRRSGRRAAPSRSRQCLHERRFPSRGRLLRNGIFAGLCPAARG